MTGTILVIIAVSLRIISNPLGNVFQKQLTSKGNHPLIVNFVTYFLLSIICMLWAVNMDWPVLSRTFWVYSVLAGIAGALGNGFLVKALHRGALSVLGPINSYKSVAGIIFGIFLLSEIPNFWGILGVILVIFGSYFVLDTTEERFSLALLRNREIQFRIAAMVLTAVEAVFIKKIILSSSTTIAFMSWCFFGAFFSFILMLIYRLNLRTEFHDAFRTSHVFRYLLLILCIGTMQFTTNYSFEHIPVGYALSLFQLSTILSILFGYRFFSEKDIGKKIIGSLIMIGGSMLIILLKN